MLPLAMPILSFNIILLFIEIYKFLFIINFMNVRDLFRKHLLLINKQLDRSSSYLACGQKLFIALCSQIIIVVINLIFIEV